MLSMFNSPKEIVLVQGDLKLILENSMLPYLDAGLEESGLPTAKKWQEQGFDLRALANIVSLAPLLTLTSSRYQSYKSKAENLLRQTLELVWGQAVTYEELTPLINCANNSISAHSVSEDFVAQNADVTLYQCEVLFD